MCDGGSVDGTQELARRRGCRVVATAPGRGGQLRAGAAAAGGRWLFFLHADCRFPPEARTALEAFLDADEPDAWAHFAFALEGAGWFWRFIEWGQARRERLAKLVYGDQGLVVSRTLYERAGGFPPWPVMEDVGMTDRLRRLGPPIRLDASLPTSPRRYDAEGRWLGWLRNTALIAFFRLGVRPEALTRLYRPRDPRFPWQGRPSRNVTPGKNLLLVFVKAPRPGRVKTRLARDVGAETAARIYRRMGRAVVDAVSDGPWKVRIYYTPTDAEEEVRDWLFEGGAEPLEMADQSPGDLGERMRRALEEGLGEAERVCVIGTDAPDLDAGLVDVAFRSLEGHDVVLGPALDGGYYLLGLRAPQPELFREIPWSTDQVLNRTLERAAGLGLTCALLPSLSDVDTLEDLPAHLRSA